MFSLPQHWHQLSERLRPNPDRSLCTLHNPEAGPIGSLSKLEPAPHPPGGEHRPGSLQVTFPHLPFSSENRPHLSVTPQLKLSVAGLSHHPMVAWEAVVLLPFSPSLPSGPHAPVATPATLLIPPNLSPAPAVSSAWEALPPNLHVAFGTPALTISARVPSCHGTVLDCLQSTYDRLERSHWFIITPSRSSVSPRRYTMPGTWHRRVSVRGMNRLQPCRSAGSCHLPTSLTPRQSQDRTRGPDPSGGEGLAHPTLGASF